MAATISRNDDYSTDETDICLYFFEHSSPSRKVLIALHEKEVAFRKIRVDLMKKEQHERWYLEKINPRGEVPVLKHGDKMIVESSSIMKYIDEHLGKEPNKLYPINAGISSQVMHFVKLFDSIPTFPLTYGAVVFHTEEVTSILRWPYCSEDVRQSFRKVILEMPSNLRQRSNELIELPAGKILREKADSFDKQIRPVFQDIKLYHSLLAQVEVVLDEVEAELSNEDRLGPWLCGPGYTAADISFSCLLLRLYQIGLDQMWKEGTRPNISVYQEMAFRRNSVKGATDWELNKNKYLTIMKTTDSADADQVNAAYWGMAAAGLLAAMYIFKKIRKN